MTGVTGPNIAPFLMKNAKAASEEVKYRTHPLGCLKGYLFWLMAMIALFVFFALLDLLS